MNKYFLYKIVYAVFGLFVLLPVVYTVVSSIFFSGSLSNNFLMLNKAFLYLLAKSILFAFLIALLSNFFGAILAFLLYKTNIKFRNIFKLLVLIPLFISPYIWAVAWKDLLFILFNNSGLYSSYIGAILVLTTIFTPLAMLIIGSALSNINSQLEDASFVITRFSNTVFKVIFPLIKPAFVSSFVLVFIFSISEFSVPVFFGVKLFTSEIFVQFSAFYNHSFAIFQSLFLVAICVILLFIEKKHLSDAPFFSIANNGNISKTYKIKNSFIALVFIFVWLFISIILPLLILSYQSFIGGISQFSEAYNYLLPTFLTSIILSFVSAVIIVVFSFSVNYVLLYKEKLYVSKTFDWVLLIVFAIPSTVFAISLIQFYNHVFLDFIYSSYGLVLIAYIGKFMFVSSKIISNALKQIPKSIDEIAQIIGVTFFSRIRKIILPIIAPSLFVAFIISFIFSFGELGATIMLYPPGAEIISVKMFTIMANVSQSITSSMALIVFAINLLVIVFFYILFHSFFEKKQVFNDRN